ncbi:hypothetical protein Q5425_14845 [Amycolatopsis sp. A133]|uniref:hypothetical protein n=1 Tax=Amycolatopsis sp. A133 TaxID=3064472 RepID=UPI0027EFE2DC|nr:hypothetical protein [Amycolatopsis sp. A133]MDQ7805020.1 hypothetical protein [Amycolatopsis sp. A133]
MRSTELAVPVDNTVRALRRLAPGACLRELRTPELRVLAGALRGCSPSELAGVHPGPVARVVLASQLRALDRAMTGFFGPAPGGPEAARLVRAARYSRIRRPSLDRVATEPGLRVAALAWAEVLGYRMLAGELRGVPEVPAEEDGRLAAELVVAALLPRVEGGTGGREVLVPWADGGAGALGSPLRTDAGEDRPSRSGAGDESNPASAFLQVHSVRVGDRGFRVDVRADPPVELLRDGDGLTLRALRWNGLGRVADDLGHEYLILARDDAGSGTVRHWCHPRPAPGARVLRLESAGYRGERLRLEPASAGTCAEVLVKLELTVRLGA